MHCNYWRAINFYALGNRSIGGLSVRNIHRYLPVALRYLAAQADRHMSALFEFMRDAVPTPSLAPPTIARFLGFSMLPHFGFWFDQKMSEELLADEICER